MEKIRIEAQIAGLSLPGIEVEIPTNFKELVAWNGLSDDEKYNMWRRGFVLHTQSTIRAKGLKNALKLLQQQTSTVDKKK